jgi:hypothetical protein
MIVNCVQLYIKTNELMKGLSNNCVELNALNCIFDLKF